MRNANTRNIIGGAIMAFCGGAIAVYAATQLPLGSLQRMGPGLFPAALGCMLAVMGLITVGTAFADAHPEPAPRPEIGPTLAVLGGLAVFALTIDRFGLLVSETLLVFISALASKKWRLLPLVLITIALCAATWAIFVWGFNMPVRLLRWNP